MDTIDLKSLIKNRYPGFFKYPKFIRKIIIRVSEKILRLREINDFLHKHNDIQGFHFIDTLFEYFNFSYAISHNDIIKIPSEGRLICVSNHPIGSLDGLALISAIGEVRPDVKIVANDILGLIPHVSQYILPFNIENPMSQRKNILAIGKALENEEAIIIFPAAEVSRLRGVTVMDGEWFKGPIYFSKKFNTPILPIHVNSKNSVFFYLFSVFFKDTSRILLSREMFNKRNKIIRIKIGEPIPSTAFTSSYINEDVQVRLLKKHVYNIGKGRPPVYKTEKNIIHKIDSRLLKKELNKSQLLGITSDNKKILLTDKDNSPNVLNELARLREVTFRKVGEGTGKRLDLDNYDNYYRQIILWDDYELEIVGSYRFGIGREIIDKFSFEGFYTSSLFNFSDEFKKNYLVDSIELGRSFVQEKYWNTRALDYLWMGIGAFIAKNPQIKYMFGGVSISNSYPELAKDMMVYYFNKWFPPKKNLAISKAPYVFNEEKTTSLSKIFTGQNNKDDYKILKVSLKNLGVAIPILYKHYTELCDEDGVQFLAFGTDALFENCIDGLILVDISKIREEKLQRYIEPFLPME